MRFVELKAEEQLDMQTLHRIRDRLVGERTALLNQADEAMWTDLPNLPLYQKPTFLAFSDKYLNIGDNTTTETPFWNVEEWGLKASAQ